jgi:hypothetical protein
MEKLNQNTLSRPFRVSQMLLRPLNLSGRKFLQWNILLVIFDYAQVFISLNVYIISVEHTLF